MGRGLGRGQLVLRTSGVSDGWRLRGKRSVCRRAREPEETNIEGWRLAGKGIPRWRDAIKDPSGRLSCGLMTS